MPDNHTQRIADVREAVQNAQGRLVGFTDTAPNVRYIRALQARLAADLEHLAEHEAAEAESLPSPLPEDHPARGMGLAMAIGKQDGRKATLRARTEEIARLLGLAQGGENA